MQRGLLITMIGLVIMAALLIILNIWGVDLGDMFYKIIGTLVVLIILIGFLMVVKMDFGDHKRLKDENYLD